MNTDSCSINICPIRLELEPERPGYRFTKFQGLTQNLYLRTFLKLEYNIKSLNYIQKNFIFHSWFLLYWTM